MAATARSLYRSLISAGKAFPVRSRSATFYRRFFRISLTLRPTYVQDYNIQSYILRRTREEFRLARGLDAASAAPKLEQVGELKKTRPGTQVA